MAGRKKREKNVIDEWGFETLLGKRGLQYLVHYERKKSNSTVPSGNWETEMSEGGYGEGQMPPLRGGGQRISPLVEMPRNTRGGRRSS